jgi:hypothetical protein
LVTRAQLIRRSVVSVSSNPVNPSWYLQEDFWDFVLNLMGIAAEVLRFADKPVAAATVERVVQVAQQRALTVRKEDLRAAMRMKLQILSRQLQAPSKYPDPLLHARIDAQIELIAEFLKEPGSHHGEEG